MRDEVVVTDHTDHRRGIVRRSARGVFTWFRPFRWLKTLLAFLVWKQPWLSAGIVALLTVVAGLAALYFANPTFGASASDWLIALSWGLGLQITGTALAQAGGSLSGSGSKPTTS